MLDHVASCGGWHGPAGNSHGDAQEGEDAVVHVLGQRLPVEQVTRQVSDHCACQRGAKSSGLKIRSLSRQAEEEAEDKAVELVDTWAVSMHEPSASLLPVPCSNRWFRQVSRKSVLHKPDHWMSISLRPSDKR